MKEGEFEIAVSQAKGYLQMLTDPSWHKDIESRTPADFWTWIQQRCQQLNPNECHMAKSKIQLWEWNPKFDSEATAKDFLEKVQMAEIVGSPVSDKGQLDILLDAQTRVPVKYMYQLQTLSTTRMKVPGAFDANEKNAAGDCTAKALFDEIHQADERMKLEKREDASDQQRERFGFVAQGGPERGHGGFRGAYRGTRANERGERCLSPYFNGNCYNCGKPGHRAVDCWSAPAGNRGRGTRYRLTNSTGRQFMAEMVGGTEDGDEKRQTDGGFGHDQA
ncbi:hypothetical protein DFJ74DRAFT_643666 [Hyaloraphidium curvatum]|nr:hypothetical protein DFJ74DRAFT_643666 [Hyaloraphidium curvatum]